jgi:hypothetical protein
MRHHYLIGGSLGSSIHGIPRATLDADLVTDINHVQVERLVEKLKSEFMIDADMVYDAIKRRSCFNIIHLGTMFKVDIFIIKNTPYDIIEFTRRKPKLLSEPDTFANVATPEDIIINKLLWYQEGGEVSERGGRQRGFKSAGPIPGLSVSGTLGCNTGDQRIILTIRATTKNMIA